MRRVITTLAVPILLSVPAYGQVADTPAAVVAAFHHALATADTAAALRWLDPDVIIYENGMAETLAEYRAHHLPADMAFAGGTTREIISQQTHVAGEVAWVLGEIRSTGTFRERAVDSRSVETMLLRRTPKGWRIVHIHWSARRGG